MAATTGARSSSSAIRSVEQITEAAQKYEYNALVPLRYWLRAAAALLKEADIYMQEGDEETTYMLLFRHAHLVLAQLEAHPDAKDKSLQPLLAEARREVDRNLKLLDALKPKINQRYERYAKLSRERDARRKAEANKLSHDSVYENRTAQARQNNVQQLHGYENSELAVRLAQQELSRRAGQSKFTDLSTYRAGDDADDLSRQLQAIRTDVDAGTRSVGGNSLETGDGALHSAEYNYPNVRPQDSRQVPDTTLSARPHTSSVALQAQARPPALPPKPPRADPATAPPRPSKVRSVEEQSSHASTASRETTYTFKPAAFLEDGSPLRTIFLPPTLRTTFLRIAYQNTKANLETCGFLAGTLVSNALFISKLIVPAQVSTSDTCEMTNESQLFDYVDSGADLMIIGWIHTHPTQTCFMSSRDLHTHAGYQMMLPESVAIVCAPSKGDTVHGGDWGVYRLTDPPGKMAILNCNKPGLFHPHEVDNIYTDAVRPGHVVEAKGLEFEVVDLRDVK